MTLLQLRIVAESVKTGSISAAADNLNVSQPNASLSIKKLEEELGYPLFRREGGGVVPTIQGYRFLKHAEVLIEEYKAVRAIVNINEDEMSCLRVGVMNISAAVDAFLLFCSRRRNILSGEYACINVSPEVGARMLSERKLDVIVSAQLKEMLPLSEKVCKENRFTMRKIIKLPVCVRVRQDHPLVVSGELDGSMKSFRKLSDYPYADYMHLEHLMSLYNQTASVPFGCSYRISVDERDTRLRVLHETDAYSVGTQLSQEKLEQYGLVSFPTGIDATLVTYTRKGDESLRDISDYLDILADEARKVFN